MKANRKFILRDDAVSPVIAVILMVAITVVLAATVYVWVSGFGQSGSQAKTISFSTTSSSGVATMTLVSAASNLNWNNIRITVDGATTYGILAQGSGWSAFGQSAPWDGAYRLSSTTRTASPGDTLKFGVATTPTSTIHLNVVDKSSNTVMATLIMPTLTGPTIATDEIATCPASTTITFAASYYTETQDSAAITASNMSRTGTAIATLTHTVGATTATANAAASTGNVVTLDSNEVYDIGGTAAADSCTTP